MPTIRRKTDAPSKPRRKAGKTPHPRTAPTTGAIATRAYEIFVQRGGEHGHALDDWVAAERELSRQALSH